MHPSIIFCVLGSLFIDFNLSSVRLCLDVGLAFIHLIISSYHIVFSKRQWVNLYSSFSQFSIGYGPEQDQHLSHMTYDPFRILNFISDQEDWPSRAQLELIGNPAHVLEIRARAARASFH